MKPVFAAAAGPCLLVLALGLGACAAPTSPGSRAQLLRNGTVAGVQPVEVKADGQLGLAAEVGTSAGGLFGNQSGASTRRDLVTVLAAIGGGPSIDDAQEERFQPSRDGQRIVVRLDNGVGIAVTQEAEPELQIGDRVRIEGRGAQARVLKEE